MIDWSPFDDRLEGKTSSNEMNFLDYLESKRIRQKCFFNETQRHEIRKDPPQPLPFGDLCHDSAMPK